MNGNVVNYDNYVELKPESSIEEASEALNAAVSNDPSLLDFNSVDALMNYALHNPDNQEAKEKSLISTVDFTLKACEKDQEKMATLAEEKTLPGITASEEYEELSDESKKYIEDAAAYIEQVVATNNFTNEAVEKWEEVRGANQKSVDDIVSELENGPKGRGLAG